jgi:hypothetical protein
MTRDFVSGLPGAAPPPLNPRGSEALMRIRERAEADMRTLKPLTEVRFDGVEQLRPDPEDVEAYAVAADTKRLIDLIMSDRDLAAPIAAALGRRP